MNRTGDCTSIAFSSTMHPAAAEPDGWKHEDEDEEGEEKGETEDSFTPEEEKE